MPFNSDVVKAAAIENLKNKFFKKKKKKKELLSRNRLVTRNVNGEMAACSVAGGISSRVRHDMFSDSKKRPGLLGLYDVRDGHVVSERGFRPLCRGVGLERIESDVHIVRAILHCRCLLI